MGNVVHKAWPILGTKSQDISAFATFILTLIFQISLDQQLYGRAIVKSNV